MIDSVRSVHRRKSQGSLNHMAPLSQNYTFLFDPHYVGHIMINKLITRGDLVIYWCIKNLRC